MDPIAVKTTRTVTGLVATMAGMVVATAIGDAAIADIRSQEVSME
jgi:hypothetical protein